MAVSEGTVEVDGAIHFPSRRNTMNYDTKRWTEISMEGFPRGFGFASKSREGMSVSRLSYDWLSFLEQLKAVRIFPNQFLPSQGKTEIHCEAQTWILGWSKLMGRRILPRQTRSHGYDCRGYRLNNVCGYTELQRDRWDWEPPQNVKQACNNVVEMRELDCLFSLTWSRIRSAHNPCPSLLMVCPTLVLNTRPFFSTKPASNHWVLFVQLNRLSCCKQYHLHKVNQNVTFVDLNAICCCISQYENILVGTQTQRCCFSIISWTHAALCDSTML